MEASNIESNGRSRPAVSAADVFGKWITEQATVTPEEVKVHLHPARDTSRQRSPSWESPSRQRSSGSADPSWESPSHRHHHYRISIDGDDEAKDGHKRTSSRKVFDILEGVTQILEDKLAKHELFIEELLAKQMQDLESANERDRRVSQLWFADCFKRFHMSMQILLKGDFKGDLKGDSPAQEVSPSTPSILKPPPRPSVRPILPAASNAGSSRGLDEIYNERNSDLSTYEVLGLSDEAILDRISPADISRPDSPPALHDATSRNRSLTHRAGKEGEREQLQLHVKRMSQKRQEFNASVCKNKCCGINMELKKLKSSITKKSFMEKLVDSGYFSSFFMIMIILNTVYIAFDTNERLSYITDFKDPPAWLEHVNVGFVGLFALELMFRIVAYKEGFLTRDDAGWNIFDLIIVVCGILEESLGTVNLQILRLFRVLRLLRVLRIIRMLRYTVGLRVYLLAMMENLLVLFWASLACLFLNFLVCMVVLQGMLEYATDAKIISIQSQFGSVSRSMDTLIRTVLGGVLWGEVADSLEEISPVYSYLLVVYIVFTILGMFNVVTALIASSTADLKNHDRDLAMHHEMTLSNSMVTELSSLLQEHVRSARGLDSWISKDILLSEFEFREFVTTPEVQLYLHTHGIDSNEAIELFHLLDHNGKKITIEQFVFGCQRLKGLAKGMDVVLLFDQVHRLADKVFEGKEWSKAGFREVHKGQQELLAGILDLRNDLNDTTKMIGLTSPLATV